MVDRAHRTPPPCSPETFLGTAKARPALACALALKNSRHPAELLLVDTPTTVIDDPSARAQALSHDLTALIAERRTQDPSLGVPDTLVALELAKASLLEDAGVPLAGGRAVLIAAVALAVAVVAFALFAVSH
jgi:hypothetical protein